MPAMATLPAAALPRSRAKERPVALARWLFAAAALVFAMVVVGGITRLTESGLSITEWKVVSGTLPPLTNEAWLAEFRAYQATTEFQLVNSRMTLGDFQNIFFWEYVHRLLGRVVGMALLLPLLWFAIRGAIPVGYGWRIGALFALVCLQGTFGWYMVASGLHGRTNVSHHWLAIHLTTALFTLGGLVWTALDLRASASGGETARLTPLAIGALALLGGQLVLGAFMAGLRAGYAYNSWPLMGDRLFPEGAPMLVPAWLNLIDNPLVVQFAHRWWAFVALAALMLLARAAKRSDDRPASVALHAAVGTQILLGIATLLTGVALWLGVLHQAVGALVVIAAVWCAHSAGRYSNTRQETRAKA